MNPNTGEIVYGDAEVIDRHGKEQGVKMVPVPEKVRSALENLSPHQRQMWAKAHRPSLDQLVEAGADLTASQKKSLQKRERRRQAALAGKR